MSDINGLLRYLERRAPEILASVRSRHPDSAPRLMPRLVLGSQEGGQGAAEPAMIDLLESSIATLQTHLDRLIPRILRRLQTSNRLKTGGAMVASLAGVCAAALVLGQVGDLVIALSTSIFGALGGLAALAAGALERSPSGVRLSLAQDVGRLSALAAEIELMRRGLARRQAVPLDSDQCRNMLDRLDAAALELLRLDCA
jgi:hypothetical protein